MQINLHFFETLRISFNYKSSEILLLREHNGNKAYNLLFLCNPYNLLSAIKDIGRCLFFFIAEYIFLKQFLKLLMVKYTYLLFIGACNPCFSSAACSTSLVSLARFVWCSNYRGYCKK